MPRRKELIHFKVVRSRFIAIVQDIVSRNMESDFKAVAKSIGVQQTQMHRLRKYAREQSEQTEAPTIDMIIELCNKYNYSCEWILTGRGEMRLPESENERLKRLETVVQIMKKVLNVTP